MVERTPDDESYYRLVRMLSLQFDCVLPQSSPGVPFVYFGSNNGKVWKELHLVQLTVVDRLIRLCEMEHEVLRSMTASELVKAGLTDPVSLFIKAEPHGESKVQSGKFRLISSVSVIDQIVERVLFAKMNQLSINMNEYIPQKPGMGLDDKGQGNLFRYMKDMQSLGPVCSTDFSGWDWSLGGSLFDAQAELRVRNSCSAPGSAWERMVRNRIFCISLSVFILKDGTLYEQTRRGVQLSGCYITSSGNSDMHELCNEMVCEELMPGSGPQPSCVMGDDGVKRYMDGLAEKYAEYGLKVKAVSIAPDGDFSFCSTHWKNSERGEPESWRKTLFRFLHHNVNNPTIGELLDGLAYDLRNHPDCPELIERCRAWVEERSI